MLRETEPPRTRHRIRYSLAIAASLAIGISGVTAGFSIAERILRVHGFFGRDGVVRLMARDPRFGLMTSPTSEVLRDWRHSLQCCVRMEGFAVVDSTLRSAGGPRAVRTAQVGAGFFDLVGFAPSVGNMFGRSEHGGAEAAALISQSLARSEFGGDQDSLGKTLMVEGRALTVIGVFPAGLADSLSPGERIDVIRPIDYTAHDSLQVLARLRTGVTPADVNAELETWARVRGRQLAQSEDIAWIALTSADLLDTGTKRVLWFSVAVGLILVLMTSVNVAHLVTARAEDRRKEIAIRWALGATRLSLFRWRLREVLLLTLPAGLAAAGLARLAFKAMAVMLPEDLRFVAGAKIDGSALLFAVSLSFLIVLCFDALPSLLRAPDSLKRDLEAADLFGRRPSPGLKRLFSHAYVVTVVGSAFVLLAATLSVLGSIAQLSRIDLGFQVENVQAVDVRMPEWKYENQAARAALLATFTKHLVAIPGVRSAVISSHVPPRYGVFVGEVALGSGARHTRLQSPIGLTRVGPGYFQCLAQKVVAGREFVEADLQAERPVVVISEATARLLGPHPQAAIGQSVRLGQHLREIVGVVANVRAPGVLESLAGLQIYEPLATYRSSMTVLVRTEKDTALGIRTVRGGLDPDVIIESTPMKTLVMKPIAGIRFLAIVLSLVAALAIGLAIAGVYGVLSQFALRQMGQIALRMAVGANAREVRRWIVWKGLSKALVGLGLGFLASYPCCRLLAEALFAWQADSLQVRLAALVLVLGATALAIWVPAVQASRSDPNRILMRQ